MDWQPQLAFFVVSSVKEKLFVTLLKNRKADFIWRNYCGKCSDHGNGVLLQWDIIWAQLQIQGEMGICDQRGGWESVGDRTLACCDYFSDLVRWLKSEIRTPNPPASLLINNLATYSQRTETIRWEFPQPLTLTLCICLQLNSDWFSGYLWVYCQRINLETFILIILYWATKQIDSNSQIYNGYVLVPETEVPNPSSKLSPGWSYQNTNLNV